MQDEDVKLWLLPLRVSQADVKDTDKYLKLNCEQ